MTGRKLKTTRFLLSVLLVAALTALCCLTLTAVAEEAPQTRVFNGAYDRMLDDLKGADTEAAYRHVEWTAGQCVSAAKPVYKIGSEKLGVAGVREIKYVLRSSDGSVTLSDLILALRIDNFNDDSKVTPFPLGGEDMQAAISFDADSDIGQNWSVMTFSLTDFDGELNNYDAEGNLLSDKLTIQNVILTGLHLYAASDNKAGSLDIKSVTVVDGVGAETVLQNFAGTSNMWWHESEENTFKDVPVRYEVTSDKVIKSTVETSNNVDEKYSAIVLKIAGSGTVSLTPIDENGAEGTAKLWTALTDLNGTAVSALTEEYVNAVISLDSLGLKKIQGVKISVVGGTVKIAQAFFSDLESIVPDTYFPKLDTSSIIYMSQFNFEYTSVGSDYDKATEACAPFGLNYILSYTVKPSNGYVTDGHLVFDGAGVAFVQMKINTKTVCDGKDYTVIKYKLTGGATLNDFRIQELDGVTGDVVAGRSPVYANQFAAGRALPTLSEANPYKAENGYKYLVIDNALTFGRSSIAGFDMYYSGAGKLLIDEIFYADKYVPELDGNKTIVFDEYDTLPTAGGEGQYWWTDPNPLNTATIEDGALKIDVAANAAVCVGGAKPGNNKDAKYRYMIFRLKADNLDMSTFRIVWSNGETSYFNADQLKTIDGRPYIVTDEFTDFVIDLYASGIDPAIEGYRLWLGGWNAEAGALYIDSVKFADAVTEEKAYGFTADVTAGEGYHYLGGGDYVNEAEGRYLEMKITTLDTLVLDEFRLAIHRGEKTLELWEKNDVPVVGGTMKFADPVDRTDGSEAEERTQTFLFDLEQLGIRDYSAITQLHAHMTKVNEGGQFKLELRYISYAPLFADIVLPTNDDSKPVVKTWTPETGKVGSEIVLSATAEDNYSQTGEIKYSYEVTFGTETIDAVNGKFTPSKEGEYTVKVIAEDKAGNKGEKVYVISVGPADAPINTGLTTGQIIAIAVAGAVVLAGAAFLTIYFIRKKKLGK